MIPVEIGEPSLRRQTLNIDLNKESLLVSLDLINELIDKCRIWEEACNATYRLEYLLGKTVPRTWNDTHLKFYYS